MYPCTFILFSLYFAYRHLTSIDNVQIIDELNDIDIQENDNDRETQDPYEPDNTVIDYFEDAEFTFDKYNFFAYIHKEFAIQQTKRKSRYLSGQLRSPHASVIDVFFWDYMASSAFSIPKTASVLVCNSMLKLRNMKGSYVSLKTIILDSHSFILCSFHRHLVNNFFFIHKQRIQDKEIKRVDCMYIY